MKKSANLLLNTFLLAMLVLTAASCKKKDSDPQPDLASRVAGTYTMTYVNDNGDEYKLPFNQQGVTISGTVVLTRVNENTVSGKITVVLNGDDDAQDVGNVTLKEKSSSEIELYEGTNKVGTVKGNQLEINTTDNGATYIVRASK